MHGRFLSRALLGFIALTELISVAALITFFVANSARVQLSYQTVRPRYAAWVRIEALSVSAFGYVGTFVVAPLLLVLCATWLSHGLLRKEPPLFSRWTRWLAWGTVVLGVLLVLFVFIAGHLPGGGGSLG